MTPVPMSSKPTIAKRDLYLNALRQAGRRITDQRRAICDYLAATTTHPTPYQVFADLSARYPEMSRATVYNTLNVLRELGAIVEIGFGADHTHYETDTTPHVNLICLRCQTILDYHGGNEGAEWAAGEERDMGLLGLRTFGAWGEIDGFQPIAMRVDLFGFCQACRARKKAEIRAQWLAQRQTENAANIELSGARDESEKVGEGDGDTTG